MKKLITLILAVAGMVGTASATEHNIYIQNRAGWDDVALYLYQPGSDPFSEPFGGWPGTELTQTELVGSTSFYKYTYNLTDGENYKLIVNNNKNGKQTVEISITTGSDIYFTILNDKYDSDESKYKYISNDVYFRNNSNATSENGYLSWNTDDNNFKFSYKEWDGTQDIYELTITPEKLAAFSGDIQFRPSHWYDMGQRKPNTGTYTFNLASQLSDTKQSTSYNSDNSYFEIQHSSVKAASYKVTLYVKSTTEEYVKAEILSMPVTISSYGMSTFCSNRALNFSDTGITANIITSSDKSNGELSKLAKTAIPANTGLFLEGSAGTVNVPVLESASAFEETNMLVGVTSNIVINQTSSSYTNYILTVNLPSNVTASTPKFYKVNSAGNYTVPAGKAYLQIPTANAARDFFWFEEETAINAVEQEQKMDGQAYNLAGQRVAQPTKGLYIVNGKKVIKK